MWNAKWVAIYTASFITGGAIAFAGYQLGKKNSAEKQLHAATARQFEVKPMGADAVVVTGEIDSKSPKIFADAMKESIRRIHLRSGGGDTAAAMEIGREIHRRGLDVIIDGICASSCANYLFVAGKKKSVVAGGYLLLHGAPSFRPLTTQTSFPNATAVRFASEKLASFPYASLSETAPHTSFYESEILEKMKSYQREARLRIESEEKYFDALGVSLDILDFSNVLSACNSDWRMNATWVILRDATSKTGYSLTRSSTTAGTGRTPAFWWSPPREDWEAVGTTNIQEFWVPTEDALFEHTHPDGYQFRALTKSMKQLNEKTDCGYD